MEAPAGRDELLTAIRRRVIGFLGGLDAVFVGQGNVGDRDGLGRRLGVDTQLVGENGCLERGQGGRGQDGES